MIKETNTLFPVFLKLETLRVLIVGGGPVAKEKLEAVLTNSPAAVITLVAIQISEEIKKIAAGYPGITFLEKAYDAEVLNDNDIVLVAINDRNVSRKIAIDARQRGILVNAADQPELCDFYLSSVVKKGNLKIAISTNGKSPTIAKRLKENFIELLPEELDELLDNMHAIRQRLNGNFSEKVKRLNELTKLMAIKKEVTPVEIKWKKTAKYSLLSFTLMLVGHFILSYLPFNEIGAGIVALHHSIDRNFYMVMLAGFLAQLVDGSLGMGYGVTSATILLSTGINPAAISGSIHTAEMFASGASGYSHYKFGNVNKKLFKALVIPGVAGAVLGAVLLTFLGDKYAYYIRPVLALYTLFLGVKILLNAFRKQIRKKFRHYRSLAGLGGFLDSFGGGGWGPIVTTTLITKGRSPRFVIGTVSLTEFFVTLASAFTFFTLLGISHWQTILALITGSLIAAPVAAKLAGRLPRKTSFILLGVLVIVWSVKIIAKLL